MAKCRPKLSTVSASDLITVGSFQWSHGHKIGEGSYGKVYLGWSKGNTEQADIAVKYIKKEHLSDKKVNENMQREINILKGLTDCPYVVRLWESLMRNGDMILFMELCDYDLDHYVKQSPFNQRDVKIFLSHIAEGLRVLQERGIVHRDLKPQNILVAVDPVTEKKQLKIADFGFARHFIEEGMKQSLHSMAGTPVFMAPEALRSVMTNCKTKYDAKVDLWSVGAVLYKCLVGQCGFYATLQEILGILESKGDAIAFERKKNPYEPVKYYHELPVEVRDRLSDDFAAEITHLLKSLLKVNAQQRLDFAEFFACVDALTKNNIQVIDALSGSTFRMSMSQVSSTPELVTVVADAMGFPRDTLVLFSADCQWMATPWEAIGVKDDLSRLNPQEEDDPVVYAVTLDVNVNGDSDTVPNLSIVDEIGNLLCKLPQHSARKVTDSVKRLMSSSAPGGLASIQGRQLKGQRGFWSLVLGSYCNSAKQLRATEREMVQSFGNSISSIETLRQYLSLSRSLGHNTQSLEEELSELDTETVQLSKSLTLFTDCMDLLAVDSAVDITSEHNDFEAEMRALRTNAVAVGNVELSQLQVASKKVQDRLKELVCSVHTSLAKGYKHGMVMLQKLSETQAAASPLQAQIHRVAKRIEDLLAKTYDVVSSSVRPESDSMVVIEVAKEKEQGAAAGSASTSGQVCAACGEKLPTASKQEQTGVAPHEKVGDSETDSYNVEDTLRTSVVEASQVSDSESTLQEVKRQLCDVLQDLAPSLSVPLLEDPPPESMESFVMCGNGGGSRVPIALELKSLVGLLKDVTLGAQSQAESVNVPSDGSMLIKVTPDLKPGDLVLFMQTRDPKIYYALLYTEKVRVFLDRVSLEQHEKDIKQSSIPGTPFILARVAAAPRQRKGPHPSATYEVTPMYSVRCTPVRVADASNE